MKTMLLNVLENNLTITNQQEGDNNATLLTIDFTGCGVDGLAKWVDFVVADGTKVAVSLGTTIIPTYNLPNGLTKEGDLHLQAYAKNGLTTTYLSKVFRVPVKRSLNVTGDDTGYDLGLVETLQDAISVMEIKVSTIWNDYNNGGLGGDSAYETAVTNGFVGNEVAWLLSLNGTDGSTPVSASFVGNDLVFTKDDATTITLVGAKLLLKGDQGIQGNIGLTGATITSASFVGNDLVFVKSDASTVTLVGAKLALKGDQGIQGLKGDTSTISVGTVSTGLAGSSVIITNTGTTTDAIFNFTIPKGDKGNSAYQVALDNGFVGTEAQWLASLVGMDGADAVAGELPSTYTELGSPQSVTSATLIDIPTMTTTINLDEAVNIAVFASFELQTQSGSSSSVLEIAINIDGVDHDPLQRFLSGSNDLGIGAIVHRTTIAVSAGLHTIKLRFRRVSGTTTPGINRAHMLVMAMQGAKGADGQGVPVGGTLGQALIKQSATYADALWETLSIARINGLQIALDGKVDDAQVLTNVPAGALFTDTIYVHPSSHLASIITQDANNRFVTDTEKTAWNGKLALVTTNATLSGLGTVASPLAVAGGGGQLLGTATVKAISYNAQVINENITIPATYNAMSVGDITIGDGFTVTLETGAVWKVV